jgi:hypothetical protein
MVIERGGFSVNRKKTMFFENRNTVLDVTFGEKPKKIGKTGGKTGGNEKNTKKNRYKILKSNHTYTSLLQMNQVLVFTHEKLKRFCLKFDNVFKIPSKYVLCIFFKFRGFLVGFRFFVETASR